MLAILLSAARTGPMKTSLEAIRLALQAGQMPKDFARQAWPNGVSGFVLHTVPAAFICWLSHPEDPKAAIEDLIRLGGDTDTTAAIVGSLVGATVGLERLPDPWIGGLKDWPRSRSWIMKLGARLAESFPQDSQTVLRCPLPLFWPALPMRNLFFLLLVLLHGFRRLLPPYDPGIGR
jgi:hypothetical protein